MKVIITAYNIGVFSPAGATPGCPEINQQILSFTDFWQNHIYTTGIFLGKVNQWLAYVYTFKDNYSVSNFFVFRWCSECRVEIIEDFFQLCHSPWIWVAIDNIWRWNTGIVYKYIFLDKSLLFFINLVHQGRKAVLNIHPAWVFCSPVIHIHGSHPVIKTTSLILEGHKLVMGRRTTNRGCLVIIFKYINNNITGIDK